MFAIDFTKPWLYKDVIYFNQGNLATNNILRCKLITGGDTTLEGYIASVTFKTLSHAEINTSANIVDKANCVIDIKFPSNSLEVGVNELEVLLNKGDGNDKVVVQSPKIKYEVWQGLTTGNGIQGDNNYPILIDLMSEVRNTVRIANNASATADASLKQAARMIEEVDNTLIKVNNTIEETNNAKDEALEAVEDVNRAIAAGTQDLEVKAAREDAEGVTHDTLALRLKSDLKIGSKSLKQEVIDLGGLKESQDMAYETDKGYLVCKETKAGTIKDLKIKGKNLINIMNSGEFNINSRYPSKEFTNVWMLKPNTLYTYIILGDTKNISQCALFDSTAKEIIFGKTNGTLFTFTTPNSLLFTNTIQNYIYKKSNIDEFTEAEIKSWRVLILEGDHTQNPPSYFEGIASVGTVVDKIEVSSMNRNLFNPCKLIKAHTTNYTYDGRDLALSGQWFLKFNFDHIPKNTDFVICANIEGSIINGGYLAIYYTDGTMTSDISIKNKGYLNLNSKNGIESINFYVSKGTENTITYKNLGIYIGTDIQNFISPSVDKKTLLFKDVDGNWKPIKELRGISTACDTVELHSDGKYYYHLRTEKAILDGTSNYIDVTISDELSGTSKYMIFKDVKFVSNDIISDKFLAIKDMATFKAYDGECCFVNKYGLSFKVLKSSLSTQDDTGFKKFLQSNNVLIIHDLAEERVFEVNPLFLEAYEGETMASVNSGVINAPMEFKIASYITNLVLLNQQRISLIEQEMFNMFKQVLSGDMYSLAEKLYPEDFIEEKYIATPIPEL